MAGTLDKPLGVQYNRATQEPPSSIPDSLFSGLSVGDIVASSVINHAPTGFVFTKANTTSRKYRSYKVLATPSKPLAAGLTAAQQKVIDGARALKTALAYI